MAKLTFYYSAMNAGKSSRLLQAAHNYEERGKTVAVYVPPEIMDRKIESRLGIEREADHFTLPFAVPAVNCIFIDEAQFLTKPMVQECMAIAHESDIPVVCYGLRTDFQGNLFEGSQWLLAWSDTIEEIRSICYCGKKATMNIRVDENGERLFEGKQVEIDKNHYTSVCAKHFRDFAEMSG